MGKITAAEAARCAGEELIAQYLEKEYHETRAAREAREAQSAARNSDLPQAPQASEQDDENDLLQQFDDFDNDPDVDSNRGTPFTEPPDGIPSPQGSSYGSRSPSLQGMSQRRRSSVDHSVHAIEIRNFPETASPEPSPQGISPGEEEVLESWDDDEEGRLLGVLGQVLSKNNARLAAARGGQPLDSHFAKASPTLTLILALIRTLTRP